MKKLAVIGAGISGISVSRMLSKKYDVTLFEKESVIGGMIKCERVNDNLFHKVGGHVFNTKNKQVNDWFWQHFDKGKEFLSVKRKAGILFNGKIIGYPIENYLYLLDKNITERIIKELLDASGEKADKSLSEYESFESFLLEKFGKTLYELYFKPYNQKIWNIDLSKVPLEWLEGKLPMPNFNDIILSNIVREEESKMVHSTFFYAKEGGSQFIVDRLSEGLKIKNNSNIESISFEKGKVKLNGCEEFDSVVFCGDVRKLRSIIKTDTKEDAMLQALNAVGNLKSNGTSNIFCETDDTDLSWLYLPNENTKAHRIIYTGNLSPSNNRGSKRKTCVAEFSGKHDYEDMVKELKRLPGNLSPISYNYEPNSYIIQDKDTRKNIEDITKILERKNLYLLGRFAEWEYYNMDKCIESAMKVCDKLMSQ
jgi:protoporphyrinogen oxidase